MAAPSAGVRASQADRREPRGVFVTGTGTEVGKTVVAAAIARSLAAEGRRVAVFKPAVTGLDDLTADRPEASASEPDSAGRPDHELLRLAAGSDQADGEIAPYRYGPPMSPHLAAELAGKRVEAARLRDAAAAAASRADALVCEGVGGFLVPLSLSPPYLVCDFAADLGLPVVVAASPALGTINHTLLTLEAVRGAGLEVAAVVLTPWPDQPGPIEESNRATIAALGKVTVEVLPPLDLSRPKSWTVSWDLFQG
jgi:dethiobiotin synthetase